MTASAIGRRSRNQICRAAVEVAEAELAYLFEQPSPNRLVSTAAAGTTVPQLEIRVGEERSVTADVFLSGSPRFISDLDAAPASRRLNAITGAVSGLYQPVLRGAEVVGVLVVVWQTRRGKLPLQTETGMRLLASEAALALERADQMSAATRLARLDPLTGLPNRRWWDEEAARVLAARQRSEEPLVVGLIDLDRFKSYNDAHGHHMGDLFLKEAAAAWRGALRESDLLARWGGEEFAVLLPASRGAEALEVLDRLRRETPREQSCSVGIAEVQPEDTLAMATARADSALYRAKASGRDCVELDEADAADRSAAVLKCSYGDPAPSQPGRSVG